MPKPAYPPPPDSSGNPSQPVPEQRKSAVRLASYLSLWAWLALRVFTSIWNAILSSARPLLEIEQQIPLWPPTAPISVWFLRVFSAPWQRWDALWYQRIITDGYHGSDGTASFHPLFPGLAKGLYALGIPADVSLLLVSSAAALLMLYWMERLARQSMDPEQASLGTLFYLFFPLAFMLFVPYSEALFLLWSVLCFWQIRQRRWYQAGLMGALAVLTRQQGLLLMFPLLWEMYAAYEWNFKRLLIHWRTWLAAGLPPLTLAGWILYRVFTIGEAIPHIQSLADIISKILIPASHAKVITIHYRFMLPWQALGLALNKFLRAPDLDLGLNLFLALVFLLLLCLAWKKMDTGGRIYSILITLVSFSFHTGPAHPYMGLPRHLWLAFPVFLALGGTIRSKWLQLAFVTLSLLGMLFLLILYVFEAWVP